MRSRAVKRPFACWLSVALAPPPSRIFSSSLRTCETRSAIKRMLASKRAEVGSTFEGNRLEAAVDCETSLRCAMVPGLETDYGISAMRRGANPWNIRQCRSLKHETMNPAWPVGNLRWEPNRCADPEGSNQRPTPNRRLVRHGHKRIGNPRLVSTDQHPQPLFDPDEPLRHSISPNRDP